MSQSKPQPTDYVMWWRIHQLTDQDMQRLMARSAMRRRATKRLAALGERFGSLGIAAAAAMPAFQGIFRAMARAELAAFRERQKKNITNLS